MAAAWSRLSPPIRAAVLALVRTALPADPSTPCRSAGLDDTVPPGFEAAAPPG